MPIIQHGLRGTWSLDNFNLLDAFLLHLAIPVLIKLPFNTKQSLLLPAETPDEYLLLFNLSWRLVTQILKRLNQIHFLFADADQLVDHDFFIGGHAVLARRVPVEVLA